jgi:DNA-binding transcriptional regulator GbsR (MarR family)
MKIKKKIPVLKPEYFLELSKFASLVGEFIEYWGFKKVHGRIWTYLFLAREPLSTHDLTQVLKISNPLVSRSISELLKYEVVLEAGKGPNGVLCFRANPNVSGVIATVLKNREKKLLSLIEEKCEKLDGVQKDKISTRPQINHENLELVKKWVKLCQNYLDLAIALNGTELDPFSNPEGLLNGND